MRFCICWRLRAKLGELGVERGALFRRQDRLNFFEGIVERFAARIRVLRFGFGARRCHDLTDLRLLRVAQIEAQERLREVTPCARGRSRCAGRRCSRTRRGGSAGRSRALGRCIRSA